MTVIPFSRRPVRPDDFVRTYPDGAPVTYELALGGGAVRLMEATVVGFDPVSGRHLIVGTGADRRLHFYAATYKLRPRTSAGDSVPRPTHGEPA